MLIPAGTHTIEFDFHPDGYVTAAYVSTYSSFLMLLLLLGAIAYSIWQQLKVKESN
jgi:hypothetical protein